MAKGDHLFVDCTGYSHHGIDCGDGQVIHFETDMWRKITSSVSGVEPPKIMQVTIEEFSQGKQINARYYDLSDGAEKVLERARSRIGESGYHLFRNNCEHFAVWCKTGEHQSSQVETLATTARRMGKELATSAVIWRFARRVPLRIRPLVYGAAVTVTAASFASKYLEQRARDRKAGTS